MCIAAASRSKKGRCMKILRVPQTADILGTSVPTVWRKAKTEADFPKPVKLSENVTGFVEDEVQAYLERKVAEYRENPTKRAGAFTAAKVSAQVRRENSEKVAA